MKTLTILLLSLLSVGSSIAQSISSDVISSIGGEYQASNGRLSFTLGESFTTYYISDESILSEGFHQSYNDVISDIEDLEEVSSFKIYPNPTSDILHMEFEGQLEKLKGSIHNTLGQKLTDFSIENQTQINISNFAQGLYFIRINNSKNQSESFRIFKN